MRECATARIQSKRHLVSWVWSASQPVPLWRFRASPRLRTHIRLAVCVGAARRRTRPRFCARKASGCPDRQGPAPRDGRRRRLGQVRPQGPRQAHDRARQGRRHATDVELVFGRNDRLQRVIVKWPNWNGTIPHAKRLTTTATKITRQLESQARPGRRAAHAVRLGRHGALAERVRRQRHGADHPRHQRHDVLSGRPDGRPPALLEREYCGKGGRSSQTAGRGSVPRSVRVAPRRSRSPARRARRSRAPIPTNHSAVTAKA